MSETMVDPSFVLTERALFDSRPLGEFEKAARHFDMWSSQARWYVWGREDETDDPRFIGNAMHFASVYGVAMIVSGGLIGSIQSIYHQWRVTGRVVVDVGHGRIAQVVAETEHGTTYAVCRLIPWSEGTFLPYWPGLVRRVRKHDI